MFNQQHIRLIAPLAVLAIIAVAVAGLSGRTLSLQGAATGQSVETLRTGSVLVLKDAKGKARGYVQTDLSAVEVLFDALERYGANLEVQDEEKRGVISRRVTIDGRRVGSFVTECKECEPIVFEY